MIINYSRRSGLAPPLSERLLEYWYFRNLGFEAVKLVFAFVIEVLPGSKRHSMQTYIGVAFPACYPQTLFLISTLYDSEFTA